MAAAAEFDMNRSLSVQAEKLNLFLRMNV